MLKKRLSVLLLLPLFAFTISTGKGPIKITGNFTNMPGSEVFLYGFLGSELYVLDTVTHQNGAFEFSYDEPLPRGFYKIGPSAEKSFLLILGEESFTISGDFSSMQGQIQQSRENEIYQKYLQLSQRNNQLFRSFQEQMNKLQQAYSNDMNGYTRNVKTLTSQLDSVNSVYKEDLGKLAEEGQGLFVGKFIQMYRTTDKESFFSKAELSDPEYSRGDMLEHKLNIYLNRFFEVKQWKEEADRIINLASEKSRNQEALYIGAIKVIYQQDQEAAYHMAQEFHKRFPNSHYAHRLATMIPAPPPQVGEKAPDFTVTTPEGSSISLSDLKGKVVLLDFWASWCGPCRKENPNVVKAYNNFKDKGFTVFNVSLDQDKNRWTSAIQADNLVWDNHGSDLKGWSSPVAKLYGVRSIPNTFLIGPDGKIIGVNLRGPALEQKLQQIFSK